MDREAEHIKNNLKEGDIYIIPRKGSSKPAEKIATEVVHLCDSYFVYVNQLMGIRGTCSYKEAERVGKIEKREGIHDETLPWGDDTFAKSLDFLLNPQSAQRQPSCTTTPESELADPADRHAFSI